MTLPAMLEREFFMGKLKPSRSLQSLLRKHGEVYQIGTEIFVGPRKERLDQADAGVKSTMAAPAEAENKGVGK